MEEWRVSIIPKYEVSSLGNVRLTNTKKQLMPFYQNKYLAIGQHPRYKVHRLVCFAFHGTPASESLVVDHIDENRTNNASSNLRWVSRGENAKPRSEENIMKCRMGAMITNNRRWGTPVSV